MLYIIALCLCTIFITYAIQKVLSPQAKHYPYRYRGLWFIYWPKWFWHLLSIRIWQLTLPKRLNYYDPHARSYEFCGIIPSHFDVQQESPKSLITDRHEDGMFIWGGDKDGRIIVAKVVRLSRRRASVFLMIRDTNGQLYTLPNQPDSNVINTENNQCWRGNGLLLECVEPMRTWRVKFNGLLRKGPRENYITDDANDDDDDDDFDNDDDVTKEDKRPIIHVRFDFLWKAMKGPVDMWRDASSRLLAHSLSREAYADWLSLKALDRDGYDQWGAFHGTINLGDNDTLQTWYLRGSRQHRWGMSDSATNLLRAVSLFSYFESGDILWLEAFSFKSGISHCAVGYIQTGSGYYYPITSTSLELSDINVDANNLKNIFANCKAGAKNFDLWWRISDGVSVCTGDPWTLRHDILPSVTASSKQGDGWGLVFMSKRFNELCPVPEREMFNLPAPPTEAVQDNFLVIPIESKFSKLVSLTGGKGASLSYLKYIEKNTIDDSLTFSVPSGIIVTNLAWEKQIEASPELKSAICNLEKTLNSRHMNKVQDECTKVLSITNSLKISEEIIYDIRKHLINIYTEDVLRTKRFAIRSSACCEDSSDASSAGQNETILGCSWSDDSSVSPSSIVSAILTCWGSQFSFHSVEYRRQRGQLINGGMAVVIQEMVEAQVAGVMFTRDPMNGSPESIAITANYGLGESVVSASAEPDTIHVRRTWRNKLKIRSKQIGEKKSKFVMKDNDSGTLAVEISSNESDSICLSDGNALKLAKIGIYVEDYFGSPRDIEFAIYQDEIYLLQSRPLTYLNEWTEYELLHEADTACLSDKEFYTTANAGEVFSGYFFPLSASTVVKMLDSAFQRDFKQREWPTYQFDPICNRNLVTFQNHCFLNIGEVVYRGMQSKITMVNRAVDLSVFGRIVTTPEIYRWAVDRFGVMSPLANLVRTGYAFYDILLNSRRVKVASSAYSSYEIDTSTTTSALELFREISRRIPEISKVFEVHTHTSAASAITQCIALVTMAEEKAEVTSSMIQDMSSLLACISNTESGEVPISLKALAKCISINDEVDEFLQMTPDEGRVWLESHPDEVGEIFRNFLYKHGHRCIKETDLHSLSWGMAPESLVSTLQTMVRNPRSFATTKPSIDLDLVFDKLNTPVTTSKRKALKYIIKMCGTSVALRERSKSLAIKALDAFRKAYRTLGQLMALESRIPDPELIFYFQHREIELLLETRSVELVTKAIRRKKLRSKLEEMIFPEISFGVPEPLNSNLDKDDSDATENDILRGTPVCSGVSKGTARVITSLHQASQIQDGDILITHSTDVGWTPYFPLLSGVATEIGGLISHGAVVAREYGLPCIVGAKGATTKIKSGETILINGKEGFIKRISNVQ